MYTNLRTEATWEINVWLLSQSKPAWNLSSNSGHYLQERTLFLVLRHLFKESENFHSLLKLVVGVSFLMASRFSFCPGTTFKDMNAFALRDKMTVEDTWCSWDRLREAKLTCRGNTLKGTLYSLYRRGLLKSWQKWKHKQCQLLYRNFLVFLNHDVLRKGSKLQTCPASVAACPGTLKNGFVLASLSPTKPTGIWATLWRDLKLMLTIMNLGTVRRMQEEWGNLISSGSKLLVSGEPGVTVLCYKKRKERLLYQEMALWKSLLVTAPCCCYMSSEHTHTV